MKGFFFLLFTISLLVMLQIQSGMLQDTTPSMAATTSAARTTRVTLPAHTTQRAHTTPLAHSTPQGTPRATTRATGRVTTRATARTTPTMRPTVPFATTKKQTGAAPALSSLGSVSILFLTNTFIQLFHLS